MNNEYNPHNALAKSSGGQLQKYSSNPIVKVTTSIVRVEESVKTAWSNEVNKSIIISAELDVFVELDRKYG